jgi:putative ABC transport system substrate-binding protein
MRLSEKVLAALKERGADASFGIPSHLTTPISRSRGNRAPRIEMMLTRGPLALALLVALVGAPLGVHAAQPEKLYRIGMLERTSAAINAANVDAFRQGLRERGYVEGQGFVIEYRSADGHDERFPALATELVRLNVDLILTRGTPAALAAKNATGTIPVLITGVGDPVGQGVVASLARPGANITGLSAAVTDIYPKRVQLLKELVPKAARIAVLFNMSNPALPPQWREVEKATRSLGIEPQLLDVRKVEDLEPAFDAAHRQRADALVVGIETLTQANQRLIVDLATRRRLPAMYASTEFTGGLISYGANYPEMYRRAAGYAHKIFRGAKPADLPVEEPTSFDLVINSKAARALGLTIPRALLLRANTVTESPSLPHASSPKTIAPRGVESP